MDFAQTMKKPPESNALVGQLQEADLAEADRIFRLAFGTFLGFPNPIEFAGDADYIRTRWTTDPSAAFGAYLDKGLVGSNFATRWGSVAFFGPLTVLPNYFATRPVTIDLIPIS
jgi:hypothetical protein